MRQEGKVPAVNGQISPIGEEGGAGKAVIYQDGGGDPLRHGRYADSCGPLYVFIASNDRLKQLVV